MFDMCYQTSGLAPAVNNDHKFNNFLDCYLCFFLWIIGTNGPILVYFNYVCNCV